MKEIRMCLLGIIIGICSMCMVDGLSAGKVEAEEKSAEIVENNVDAEVYVICDVVGFNVESGEIDVLMQTGDVVVYFAEDLPFEFDLVCFKTNNLDDFTTYEIVALR